tara:strand:- start:575 stop:1831 length:1257 start_codon:yes stop_codon:yes gene_type:complete
MFKTFKDWLESKSINKDAFEAKTIEEKATLQKDYMAYVSQEIKEKGASKEALDILVAQVANLPSTAKVTKMETDLGDALEQINVLKEKTGKTEGTKKTFQDGFAEVKSEIIGIVKGTRSKEVVIKAPTVRASIATSNSQLVLGGIGQLGFKLRGLYNLFNKIPVATGDHGGKVTYTDWDEGTTVLAAAKVAEGGTFPEATAKFKSYSIDLVKIGSTLPVSEEFGEDQVSAAAELEMFIDTDVQTKVDADLVNGAGTSGNLKGVIASVPAFTPVASGIPAANIFDLVKKVRTDITKNRGSKYSPDFVAMNADTLDLLQLEKDANNNYIFPDKSNIGAIIIVEDNNIADNVLVVGDSRYARIYEMAGTAISRGLKGDQFVEDMETIKARKRLLFLIRNVDQTGFRKVTSISAALTTIQST